MRPTYAAWVIALASVLGTDASPIASFKLAPRIVPQATEIVEDGGRIYQGTEPHSGPISKTEINHKSEAFYGNVRAKYEENHPSGNYAPQSKLSRPFIDFCLIYG